MGSKDTAGGRGGCCCSSGGVKPSGRLLEVWRARLDARAAVLEGVEGVRRLGWFLVWSEARCLWWSSLPVVGEKAEGRVLLVGGVLASNGAESERM